MITQEQCVYVFNTISMPSKGHPIYRNANTEGEMKGRISDQNSLKYPRKVFQTVEISPNGVPTSDGLYTDIQEDGSKIFYNISLPKGPTRERRKEIHSPTLQLLYFGIRRIGRLLSSQGRSVTLKGIRKEISVLRYCIFL